MKLSTSSLIASNSEMLSASLPSSELTSARSDRSTCSHFVEQLAERQSQSTRDGRRNRTLELAAQVEQAEADHGQVLHRAVVDVGGEAQQAAPEALRELLGSRRGSGIGILQR